MKLARRQGVIIIYMRIYYGGEGELGRALCFFGVGRLCRCMEASSNFLFVIEAADVCLGGLL